MASQQQPGAAAKAGRRPDPTPPPSPPRDATPQVNPHPHPDVLSPSPRFHVNTRPPTIYLFPPEPPANSTEQQRAGCGEANDDWSGFGERPGNRFHGGSRFIPLMCVYFSQGGTSGPQLGLVRPSRTLGKLRRGRGNGGASSEAGTPPEQGFAKTS